MANFDKLVELRNNILDLQMDMKEFGSFNPDGQDVATIVRTEVNAAKTRMRFERVQQEYMQALHDFAAEELEADDKGDLERREEESRVLNDEWFEDKSAEYEAKKAEQEDYENRANRGYDDEGHDTEELARRINEENRKLIVAAEMQRQHEEEKREFLEKHQKASMVAPNYAPEKDGDI